MKMMTSRHNYYCVSVQIVLHEATDIVVHFVTPLQSMSANFLKCVPAKSSCQQFLILIGKYSHFNCVLLLKPRPCLEVEPGSLNSNQPAQCEDTEYNFRDQEAVPDQYSAHEHQR